MEKEEWDLHCRFDIQDIQITSAGIGGREGAGEERKTYIWEAGMSAHRPTMRLELDLSQCHVYVG